MATPVIAGVIALYKQAKGKTISPLAINAALSSTAVAVNLNDGANTYPHLTSIAQQGGGLVDAYHMIHAGITVNVANLALNDTANHVKNAAFYVENTGTTTQNYVLTHQLALTAYVFKPNDTYDVTGFYSVAPIYHNVLGFSNMTFDIKGASAVISPSTLTLKPGEKKRVTAAIVPDPSLQADLVPVYSGYINISTTTGSETIHLPYLGVATDMNSIPIMNTYLEWPYWDNSDQSPNTTTIETYQPSQGYYPLWYWANTWATKEKRIDVVAHKGPNPVIAAGLATLGPATDTAFWNPRSPTSAYSSWGFAWDGTFANGSSVKSCEYYLVLREAKAFANLARGAGRSMKSTRVQSFIWT